MTFRNFIFSDQKQNCHIKSEQSMWMALKISAFKYDDI